MTIEHLDKQQPADRPDIPDVFKSLVPLMPGLGTPDEDWRTLALAWRNAVESISPITEMRCLPGEKDDCGGTYQEHALGYIAQMTGWCLSQLGHWKLTPAGIVHVAAVAASRVEDVDRLVGHGHTDDVAAIAAEISANVKQQKGNQ